MNKVKFQAETGAELRKQMLDFLGLSDAQFGSLTPSISGAEIKAASLVERQEALDRTAKIIGLSNDTPINEEKIEETPQTNTRKRRTKAEIEAEKAAENQSGDTPTDAAPEDVVDPNLAATQSEQTTDDTPTETTKSEITRPFLTEIVLAKGREGKKPAMLTLFATYKQLDSDLPVTGLPTLNPADYEDFYSKVKDL